MNKLIESYIRKIVRSVISESLILEISAEEKIKAYAKSNERIPFNSELMKQAIMQGREVGLNFKSNNEKYTMPTTKTRIIQPVAYGVNKSGRPVVRGLHITGQSEKEAIRTGRRSAEVEAEKDGINAWRMFKVENIKSMWFTDRFFSDNIPGYNPNDKGMSTIYVSYNPVTAKKYQDEIVAAKKSAQKTISPKTSVEPIINTTADKDIEQMGYEDKPIQEKNIKKLFK
jgi:hypothetical protein